MKYSTALLVILALGAPALAQDEAPLDDHAAVNATILALQNGDAEEYGWLVSQVETLRFIEKPFATPGEAFNGLSGCEPRETGRKSFHMISTYSFEWECEGTTWVGSIMPDENGKSVALVDLLPKAKAEAIIDRPIPAIPPPAPIIRGPMTEAERALQEARRTNFRTRQITRATAMATALSEGNVSHVLPTISSDARISYSFHNPFLSQPFVERRGTGGDAFADQVRHIYAKLGQPESASCDGESYPIICRWSYPAAGQTLFAFITVNGAEEVERPIFSVDFRYATIDKLKEARERAGS